MRSQLHSLTYISSFCSGLSSLLNSFHHFLRLNSRITPIIIPKTCYSFSYLAASELLFLTSMLFCNPPFYHLSIDRGLLILQHLHAVVLLWRLLVSSVRITFLLAFMVLHTHLCDSTYHVVSIIFVSDSQVGGQIHLPAGKNLSPFWGWVCSFSTLKH